MSNIGVFDEFYNFECVCTSDEHRLSFRLQDGNVKLDNTIDLETARAEYVELYTSIFLAQHRSIFRRIWVGIKYVFGYKSRYGHWDSWSVRDEDVDALIAMLQKFKNLKEKYKQDLPTK
jgi:hypothetical protein